LITEEEEINLDLHEDEAVAPAAAAEGTRKY